MKKRVNIIFYGVWFLAALLAEAYCFQVLMGDLFSTIGTGIVVLITGYLFMDSIRTNIKSYMDNVKFFTDRVLREEIERWSERYTELVNIQKATYTATKKNTAILTEQVRDALLQLETQEKNNIRELQRINELQKKSMEGQKNALNMEIHYNRENTKSLISVLREDAGKSELSEQLSKVLELLEANNKLLRTRIARTDSFQGPEETQSMSEFDNKEYLSEDYSELPDTVEYNRKDDYESLDMSEASSEDEDYAAADMVVQDIDDDYAAADMVVQDIDDDYAAADMAVQDIDEDYATTDMVVQDIDGDYAVSDLAQQDLEEEHEPEKVSPINVTPLYADPNKALSNDEIAALFASFGQ